MTLPTSAAQLVALPVTPANRETIKAVSDLALLREALELEKVGPNRRARVDQLRLRIAILEVPEEVIEAWKPNASPTGDVQPSAGPATIRLPPQRKASPKAPKASPELWQCLECGAIRHTPVGDCVECMGTSFRQVGGFPVDENVIDVDRLHKHTPPNDAFTEVDPAFEPDVQPVAYAVIDSAGEEVGEVVAEVVPDGPTDTAPDTDSYGHPLPAPEPVSPSGDVEEPAPAPVKKPRKKAKAKPAPVEVAPVEPTVSVRRVGFTAPVLPDEVPATLPDLDAFIPAVSPLSSAGASSVEPTLPVVVAVVEEAVRESFRESPPDPSPTIASPDGVHSFATSLVRALHAQDTRTAALLLGIEGRRDYRCEELARALVEAMGALPQGRKGKAK